MQTNAQPDFRNRVSKAFCLFDDEFEFVDSFDRQCDVVSHFGSEKTDTDKFLILESVNGDRLAEIGVGHGQYELTFAAGFQAVLQIFRRLHQWDDESGKLVDFERKNGFEFSLVVELSFRPFEMGEEFAYILDGQVGKAQKEGAFVAVIAQFFCDLDKGRPVAMVDFDNTSFDKKIVIAPDLDAVTLFRISRIR